jgi:hypothetical protein
MPQTDDEPWTIGAVIAVALVLAAFLGCLYLAERPAPVDAALDRAEQAQ